MSYYEYILLILILMLKCYSYIYQERYNTYHLYCFIYSYLTTFKFTGYLTTVNLQVNFV